MSLTQIRAKERFSYIEPSSISYRFHLNLEAGTQYQGFSEIQFSLLYVPEFVPLDSKVKQVRELFVNGQHIQNILTQQGFILLKAENLRIGENVVGIVYRTQYDKDGHGCVSFIDTDQKQYLYTQFEPYFANKVFVLFDQPDLKAKMELSIIYPQQFQRALSNEYAIVDGDFEKGKYLKQTQTYHLGILSKFIENKKGKMSIFPQTKILPTYLYCFVAGPYQQIQLKETYKNIPMSLYCLESLFEYLEKMAPFIFEITIQSMKFFESFFGYEYAFNKYDQIFAHDYSAGAMENAGIVTFNDDYLWKHEVTLSDKLKLASTISHELSHHWFGNLVTMKWWNDLWLNEAFAVFISFFCLEKIKENVKTVKYETIMIEFLNRKQRGFRGDSKKDTHPIRAEVPNTVIAYSIFDGITYSKGAAALQQLLFLISEQSFSAALKGYFKKYEWKNSTLQDFTLEMQKHYHFKQFSFEEWKYIWLQTVSFNNLEPIWNSSDGKLQIVQTPLTQQHPYMRPHKVKVAFFKGDCSCDVVETLVLPNQNNIVQFDPMKQYKGVLLNYGNHTFAKWKCDKESLAFFQQNISKINDPLSRALFWRSYSNLVNNQIPNTRYLEASLGNLMNQKSDSLFELHFTYLTQVLYSSLNDYQEVSEKIFNFIIEAICSIGQEGKLVILKNALFTFALSVKSRQIMLQWKKDKFQPLKGHKMTLQQQWRAVNSALIIPSLTPEQKQELQEWQAGISESQLQKISKWIRDSIKINKKSYQRQKEQKIKSSESQIMTQNFKEN